MKFGVRRYNFSVLLDQGNLFVCIAGRFVILGSFRIWLLIVKATACYLLTGLIIQAFLLSILLCIIDCLLKGHRTSIKAYWRLLIHQIANINIEYFSVKIRNSSLNLCFLVHQNFNGVTLWMLERCILYFLFRLLLSQHIITLSVYDSIILLEVLV